MSRRRKSRSEDAPAREDSDLDSLVLEPIGPAPRRRNERRRPSAPPPPRPSAARQDGEERGETTSSPIPIHLVDRNALEVVRRLRRFGYKAYLVGGCVRDLLLDLTPKDFDVATSARPEEVKEVFRNSRIIGRRFRLAHIYFRGGKIIETSTFRAKSEPQDDEEDLLIRRDNIFGSEEEDALRRDFTINGLFFDTVEQKIIDHVGGLQDLRERRLRMIGPPDIRLREDPVRIIRAARISAKAGLEIEEELLLRMKEHKSEISRCPKPRVLEETLKLLRGGYAAASIARAHEAEILDVIFPEVAEFLAEDPLESEELDLFTCLEALDRRMRRTQVSDVVALAALLLAPLEREMHGLDGQELQQATNEHLSLTMTRIGATRRMSERIRQIFTAQKNFPRTEATGRRRGRRISPNLFVKRSYFEEALDLFEIATAARDGSDEDVKFWRRKARTVAGPVEEDDPPKRRRRSRRGGRRRR